MSVHTSTHTAVNLFSGAGGLSLGLEEAGWEVRAASDSSEACRRTYERNFQDRPFLHADARDLSGTELVKAAGIGSQELDLLAGGPPCQGFSILGRRVVEDPRNNLFREFFRLGGELRPKAMVIENVPGLCTLAGGAYLDEILAGYAHHGYEVAYAELLAAQYGAPQMRWRMIFVGFRRDLDIDPRVAFPLPTRGDRGIGELIPNCTIPPEDWEDFVCTCEAIGDLPPVAAGEQVHVYEGSPACPYQKRAREGLDAELWNHYAPRMSRANLDRIARLLPGQDWRHLPHEMLPEGMKRAKRKDHTRRYRRMTWEGVPRAIITRFRDPKSGEYTHPDQDRTLSIREAARIQGFPDRVAFEGTLADQYEQVGNAVPVQLAEAVGRAVGEALDGTATSRLVDPFRRRPSMRQARLPLHTVQE